jgi:outer membrane biosynthesis protein TonB
MVDFKAPAPKVEEPVKPASQAPKQPTKKPIKLQPKKTQAQSKVKKFPEKIDLSKVDELQSLSKSVDTKKFANSTVIKTASYNKATRTLTVIEKGGIAREYEGVPESVKREFFNSGKPGKFYHTYIQTNYGKKKELVKK